MYQMKKLTDCMSPLNWLLSALAMHPAMFILFRPTLLEFIVMLVVDILAFPLCSYFERTFFMSLFPDTRSYFNGLEMETVRAMSTEQRVFLCESFMRFPKRRAIYVYLTSFIKVSFPILVIVFYWKHEISNFLQFLTILAVALVNLCYFCGAVFIDAHVFLSNKLAELHGNLGLSEAFERCQLSYSKREFEIQELLILLFIIFFMLGLQITVIVSGQFTTPLDLALKMSLIGAMGVLLFARIWIMGRELFVGGLENIFFKIGETDYLRVDRTLALHTSPLLAHFEKAYNFLITRLRASEQEISALVVQETEKGRYRALGEMSAVIAHDLSGPLHAAQFWSSELLENPEHPRAREFALRIDANVKRASELTTALRAKIRNPNGELKCCSFESTHRNVLKLLELQILKTDFQRIGFHLDPRLMDLQLEIPPTDLAHILDNLYRNSTDNFIKNSISNPELRIDLIHDVGNDDKDNEFVEIMISDNGTGLSREEFEDLTSFYFSRRPDETAGQRGLGLRLTRRLVELNSGDLMLVSRDDRRGSCFNLKLKIFKQNPCSDEEMKPYRDETMKPRADEVTKLRLMRQ